MLASDLAEIYGVETRALNQAVKRNPARFPSRFMFQLTAEEAANLKSQSVISSWGGARRALPFAFTEHGAVMLAAVLNSERAVHASGHIGKKRRTPPKNLV
ncbi:MAG: ORF6N domain-containing protein [Verrucomicrobia bacterium]|nr:ORF6N domain-containing protein [Verrucomicrobiota bacterium]